MVEHIIFGIVTGSILLLGAVGFSMIQKTQNFVHIGHGQFLLLGAYFAYFFNVILHLNLFLSAVISIFICMLLGVVVFRVVFYPIRKQRGDILLFTSIGLAYLIQGIVAAIAGTNLQAFDVPPVTDIKIAGFSVLTKYELIVVICGIAASVLLYLFLNKTLKGKMIRAMANNYDLAQARGIDARGISDYIWLIASGLGALAGILVGLIGSLDVMMGWTQIMLILSATVLGGLGSIYGVMFASLLLGLSMDLGVIVIPSHYQTAIAFAIIILVLVFMPRGLQQVPEIFRSRFSSNPRSSAGADKGAVSQ